MYLLFLYIRAPSPVLLPFTMYASEMCEFIVILIVYLNIIVFRKLLECC